MPDITLSHPDLDRTITAADHQAPAFMKSGWQPAVAVIDPPNRNAKVADWESYARTVGIDPDGMTKAQIIAAVDEAAATAEAATAPQSDPAGEPENESEED